MSEANGVSRFRVCLLHDPEGKYLSAHAPLRDGKARTTLYREVRPGGSLWGYTFEELWAMGEGMAELEVRAGGGAETPQREGTVKQ
jgi:hypothetical protein